MEATRRANALRADRTAKRVGGAQLSVEAAGLGHLRAGDRPLVWHDLRHTFASHAVRAMPSLSDVQALCGHAHISTTMRYVHYRPAAGEAERLTAAFAEPDPLERAVSQDVSPTGRIGARAA